MLARLILALLLAAFALPGASAACHDAPVAMAGTHHAPAHVPDKAMAAHACIGCIPPGDWMPARVVAPLAPSVAVPWSPIATLDLRAVEPPGPPPPRSV